MENEILLEELGKLQQTELTLGEVRNAKGFEAAIEEIKRLKKESAYWEFKATCYVKDCQKIQAELEESRKTLSKADIDGKILDLSDQLLQPRGWDDANWQAQSIEVASLMYRAATQLRILLRSVQTLESQYGVLLNQRDEARQEICESHCDSLAVVLGSHITPQDYAQRRSWDCFKEDGK